MRRAIGIILITALLLLAAFAAVTPNQILSSATAFQGESDYSLRVIDAYSLSVMMGVTSPSVALANAASYQSLDDHSLGVITAYSLAQMQAGGGIGGGTFSTNWVSSVNTTSRAKTNFTDQQFVLTPGQTLMSPTGLGVTADNGIILGGSGNTVTGSWGVVVGGRGAFVGGQANFVGFSYPNNGAIALGTGNAIVAGQDNATLTNAQLSFLGSGNDCLVVSRFCFLGCGDTLQVTGPYGAVVGGFNNTLGDDANYGGDFGFIGGGSKNHIANTATNAFIGGGGTNSVSGNMSSVVAGENNNVTGSNSMAVGSSLTISGNDSVVVGIGAHNLTMGPLGTTNTDGYYGPNGQVVVTAWAGNTGGQAIPASTTCFYAANGNSATNIATADVSGFTRNVVTRTVTLGNLYVVRLTAGGVGHSTTVTIRTNGVDSNIVATLNNSQTGNDTAHNVTILAGTEVGIKIITPASDTPSNHSWSFEAR